MCESHAYLKKGDTEELILSEVSRIEPIEGGYRLSGLFGDEVTVKGRIADINLLRHKILFEAEE